MILHLLGLCSYFMKLTRLKLEEAGIWLATYVTLLTLFLICVAFFGDKIKSFLENEQKINALSSEDIKYLEKTYGQENPAYTYINNVLEFIGAYIPSNILILLFFIAVYILYFLTVKYIEKYKPSRNSYIVYFANALSSIASSVSSLMVFITSVLLLGIVYVCYVGLFLGHIFWLVLIFIILYLIFSMFIFLLDKSLAEKIKKSTS